MEQVYSFTSSRHEGAARYLGCEYDGGTHPDFFNYAKDVRPHLERLGLLPHLPAIFGHGHSFPQHEWKMLGNGPDNTVFPGFGGCGDCAAAGPMHEEMSAAVNSHRPIPEFTGDTCVSWYEDLTKKQSGKAYDRQSGRGDRGLNPVAVFRTRQEEGLPDVNDKRYKIGQVIEIDPNPEHIWEAAYLFETPGAAFSLTEAQDEQYQRGQPQPTWDYVPGSPEIGGHYVPIVGKLGLLSWGEDVYYTPSFIENQMMRGWAYIDIERYNQTTGQTAEHYSDQDLERFLHELAAQVGAGQTSVAIPDTPEGEPEQASQPEIVVGDAEPQETPRVELRLPQFLSL